MSQKRPREEEDEATTLPQEKKPHKEKEEQKEIPYFFVSPFPISDTGLTWQSWSPSSTPEGAIIEQAIRHAMELQKAEDDDDSRPDCYIGTLIDAMEMLKQKRQAEKGSRKLFALCKKHWPSLLEVKDFGKWECDEEISFITAHVILYYGEDAYC